MTDKMGVRIKWLGCASFEMDFGGVTVVNDPWITDNEKTDLTWEAVEKCDGKKPEIVDCGDFTSAVQAAAKAAEAGDVVLMSPACAAFDQFKNFMERGAYYKKLVKEL